MIIASTANQKIKRLVKLREDRIERNSQGVFVVEGKREIAQALAGGFNLIELFFSPGTSPHVLRDVEAIRSHLPTNANRTQFTEISEGAFRKAVMRDNTDGVVAEFAQKKLNLSDLRLGSHPLIVASEDVEKPGNLGALIRTCDGLGVDAFLMLNDGRIGHNADVFNPHLIRNSLGTCFRVPVISMTLDHFLAFCGERRLSVTAATADGALPIHQVDLRPATTIVLGSEAHGISAKLRKKAHHLIAIPMQGSVDSLNVAAAGAILIYEAWRQRQMPS